MSERASHLIIGGVDLEIWDTVARNGIGAPAVASTVSAMTDTSKVYVYTGSESGYTAGNWYYYNGSAWVSGGVYNSTAFETDETLTEQGAAADAKAVGDAIADIQSALVNKANVDGAYEQMTVGNAEQLVSNVGIEDSVPYNFRTSGGSADIGDREVDKIIGGTVAWNQLVNPSNIAASTTSNDVTFTKNADGTVSVSGSASAMATFTIAQSISIPVGHKVLIKGCPSGGTVNTFRLSYLGTTSPTSEAGDGAIVEITENANAGVRWLQIVILSGYAISGTLKFIPQVFDLTAMFGATIADYIYALETANAGAGVAWFKKLFPKPYYAYNAGELMSVQTSAHKMVGFNQLESAENSASATPYANALCGQVKLLPNTTYCLSFVAAVGHKFYTNEKLWTNRTVTGTGERQYVIVTTVAVLSEDDAAQYDVNYGWRLCKNSGGNTVLPNFTDVCINLSWDGERDGEYEEYKAWEYPLDSDLELRGIPKLSAGNDLYYDGDTYESDGTVTRKYGYVELDGSEDESWEKNSTFGSRFYIRPTPWNQEMPGYVDNGSVIQVVSNVCATSANKTQDNTGSMESPEYPCFGFWSDGAMVVRVEPYGSETITTVAAFRTWLSQHPIKMVYPLVEQTTEQADPYQNPQIVDDFGTEEYVDSRDVAIPVGHDTFYQSNLKAKLEMAPNSPDGDGDYVVRQTNGQNEYVPILFPASDIPAAPTENGTYALKVTVSGGTATYAWVSE